MIDDNRLVESFRIVGERYDLLQRGLSNMYVFLSTEIYKLECIGDERSEENSKLCLLRKAIEWHYDIVRLHYHKYKTLLICYRDRKREVTSNEKR